MRVRISNRKAFAHVVGNLSERANIFMLFLLKGVYRNFILFSFTNVSCQICNFLIPILMFIMMRVVFCQNCHLGPCFYMADSRSTGLCILWPNSQLLASFSLRACSSCWWNLQQFCEQCGLTLTVECCFSPVYEGSSVTLFYRRISLLYAWNLRQFILLLLIVRYFKYYCKTDWDISLSFV